MTCLCVGDVLTKANQRSLSTEILQISTRISFGTFGQGLDLVRSNYDWHLGDVTLQNSFSSLLIRHWNVDNLVQSTWSQDRRINHLWAVGCYRCKPNNKHKY